MKTCTVCKLIKLSSEFYQRKTRNNQLQSECKECCRIRRAKWWKSEKGKLSSANTKLKQRFGITLINYNEMLQKQNYKCAICFKAPDQERLAVDHCHTTNKIRKLLCKQCNLILGNCKENPDILFSAINYLKLDKQEVNGVKK